MDRPYLYEILVEGTLPEHWTDWFGNLAITNQSNQETTLRGTLVDQAALVGVISRIHALNLSLISVHRISSTDDLGNG